MSDCVRVWCLRHAESQNVTAGLAGPCRQRTCLRR
jgi:hypothetical protein